MNVVRVLSLHLLWEAFACPYLVASRVGLQRSHRGDEHRSVRFEARVAALDIEEALGAHVGPEARLGHEVVTPADADLVGHDGGVARSDVAEGSSVDKGGRVLEGLHEVGFYCLFHDDRHYASG